MTGIARARSAMPFGSAWGCGSASQSYAADPIGLVPEVRFAVKLVSLVEFSARSSEAVHA